MFRRYVAKYVKRQEVFERLAAIPPNEKPGDDKFKQPGYSPKALMVERAASIICLIDITAYSKLTAILAQRLGRFGSEIISDTVGKYLSQIIDLIEKDKGDVVKFLGDAILVRFDVAEICKGSWSPNGPHIPAMAIKHVIDCCLDILSIYHEYSVDFQQLHRPQSAKTSTSNHLNVNGGNNSSVNIVGVSANELEDLEGYKLSLHIGLAAGDVDNVIIGLPGERMDYTIAGPPLQEIGDLLKVANGGELSLPTRLWEVFESEYPIFIRGRCKDTGSGISVITKLDGQASFNPGFTMPTTRNGRRSSLVPLPSSVVRNVSQGDIPNLASFSSEAQVVFRQFVNASLVHKIDHASSSRENISGDSDEISEYRRMTIMFVKLKFPFDPNLSQLCIEICLDSLSRFDGVLQQFSVDDKGTTILAAFGLPPHTHENECDFSLKCAFDIESKLKATELAPFCISLATGDTLFSVLGNATRSEAGLLSDVVVIAARLMELDVSHNAIVCDDATRMGMEKEECADSFACVGQFQLKGRTDYISVWKIIKPITRKRVQKNDRRPGDGVIGYAMERELLRSLLETWKNLPAEEGRTVMVEGESGIGKTYLASHFQQHCKASQIPVCFASAIEIERTTPHFIFQSIITQLFMIVAKHQSIFGLPPETSMVKSIRRFSDGFSYRGSGPTTRTGSVPNSRYGASFSSSVSYTSEVSSPDRRRSMASTSSSHTRRKVMLPSHLAGYAPVVNIVTDLVQQSSDTCDDDGRSTSALSSFVNLNGMQDNRIVEAKVAAITIEAEPPPILVPPIHAELPRLFQDPPTGITRRVTVDVVEDSSSSRNNRYLLNPLGGVKSPPTGLNLSPDQLGASNSNLGAGLKNSLNPGSILSFNSSLRSNTIAHGSMLSIFSSGVEPQADAVVSIMHKLGESEWLPLLNFLPWFLHEENETTKYLNQTARANCIALLIARLIDKVAARLRIVIMLDNAQWLDSFSLETLLALVKIGQQPFIIVFTRPTTDVHVSQVFHKVSDIPSTTSLVIRGLTEIDVEEMIKQQYGASITSVDPVITKTIFKKCGGHPFFSLQLIQALKDFGKDHIAVTAKRRLAIVSKNLDLDHLLVNDVQTAIMAQFDRLNPDFQRILKAASIMGQYFDLEDLAGVLDDGGDINVEYLENIIKSHDKHSFLAKVNDEELTGVKDEDTAQSYGFKNVLILSSISASMPVSQKQGLHGRIAQYFESTLNEENVNILLPTISFHYSNSTNMPKCIDYLELLAIFQMDNRLFSESANTIEFLLSVLYRSSDRDIREQFPSGPPTVERKAQWLALLAESRNRLRQSDEALRKLKSALVLLGSPWPTSPFKLKVSLWKLEMRYLLSRPKFRHGNAKITPIEVERAGILMRIMCTLSQCYEWEGTLNEASLAAFLMLGMAITSKSEIQLVQAIMKVSLCSRRRNCISLSQRYCKEGMRLRETLSDFRDHLIIDDLSAILYQAGQIDTCLTVCRRFLEANQDTDPSYVAAGYMAALLMQKGKFEDSRNVFLSDSDRILASEDPLAQALLFIMIIQNNVLINDNLNFADGSRDWFAVSADKLLATYTYLNFGLLASIAIHYLYHKEWSKALSALAKISQAHIPPAPCILESAILLCFYIGVMLTEKDIVLSTADRDLVIKSLQITSDMISKGLKAPIHILEPTTQSFINSTILLAQGLLNQASQHLQKHLSRSQALLKDRPFLACLYYALMIKFRPLSGPKFGTETAHAIKSETQALLSALGLQQIQKWIDS